ncbi:methyltransferase domain protein [Ceratobasidium sp. AG-Ba]|nr:methyltransferase domain protein [Ceratobasidium sp. AG-Ba]QRW10257.1 methyltransferase domain protein [Ceratobasidium sp. AG-Ba]
MNTDENPPVIYLVDDQGSPYDSGGEHFGQPDNVMYPMSNSSRATMSTLGSDEALSYFRTIQGHVYEADERVPITFPVDLEKDRLNVLFHTLTKLVYNGANVPHEVDTLLRANGVDGLPGAVQVLDLVTNSGAWVQEMASAYPDVSFVSVDSKPLVPHEPHRKITFQVYDFYAEIRSPTSTFDLVHIHEGVYATKDFNQMLREAHRVLKPGGFILITELPLSLYDATTPSTELSTGSHQAEASQHLRNALGFQGIDITIWDSISARLASGHPMWQSTTPSGEPHHTSHSSTIGRGFHSIVEEQRLVPSSPWSSDEDQQLIGGLARLALYHFWKGVMPLLALSGWDRTEAQALIDAVLEEHQSGQYNVYVKCYRWYARKL